MKQSSSRKAYLIIILILALFSALLLFLDYRKNLYLKRQLTLYENQIQHAQSQDQMIKLSRMLIWHASRPLFDFLRSQAGYALGG